MHILILPAGYPNQYKTQSHSYVYDQVKALSGSEHQISVLAIIPISLKQVFFKIKNLFKLQRTAKNNVITWLYQFPSVPKMRLINNFIRMQIWKKLFIQYIKKHGLPDIVHVHIYLAGGLAIWIKEQYGIPFVVTEHYTHFARDTLSVWQNNFAKNVFRKSDLNIAVSHEFCHLLESIYSCQFVYVPNCVNTDFFKPKKKVQPRKPVMLVNVAYLEKKKNHRMLIKAFEEAFGTNPKYHLLIAGDGPEKKKLEKLVAELKMEKNITLFGMATKDQVLDLMQKSDLFVLSSEYETFGVVLIEALSCGMPVVSTRSGGPESIIKNNSLGYLCKIDQMDLANTMRDAVHKTFDYKKIRQYCIEHFSEEVVAEKLLDIYTGILDENV